MRCRINRYRYNGVQLYINKYTRNFHSCLMWFWPASSLICGNKMPARCNRGFYCRSYCLLNMFRAPLCTSSGAQEYYTVVAACGISCCCFQVAGLVRSWGLCVRFAGCWFTANRTHNPQLHTRPATWKTTARNTTRSNHCIILLSSWWWAQWCPKHVEQAIRPAKKTSVASSWHFVSTYRTQSFRQLFRWFPNNKLNRNQVTCLQTKHAQGRMGPTDRMQQYVTVLSG